MNRPSTASLPTKPAWLETELRIQKISTILRRLGTGLIMVPAIFIFLLHGFIIKLTTRDRKTRTAKLVANVVRYSRFALRRLRIQVRTIGEVPRDENFLLVCNHMSYVDLMIIAATYPSVFVTSIDMGEIFFLGTMAEIGGSVFIERRHRNRIGYDIEQMAQVLRDGFNVILFPEGTSTNGTTVQPFRKSLLLAAGAAGKRILPLTLKYDRVDGSTFGPQNRDQVCWYGDMSFLPHFLQLLANQSVAASLTFHLPIRPREGDTKDSLAKWTHKLIASGYHGGSND